MYTLEWLVKSASEVQTCIDGKYVPARPISGTFYLQRLKDALAVYFGKADAFIWPCGQ
jgi:hypothetical protein